MIGDADAETDPVVALSGGEFLGGSAERRRDAASPSIRPDEDILDLRDAELRVPPPDVCVADRIAVDPRDEVGLRAVEPV